jgi:propanediol utilization protein
MNTEDIVKAVLEELKRTGINLNESLEVPVGVSNRHVHLSEEHVEVLFGKGKNLTPMKELSQPGQYACEECVTLVGAKGVMEKVRVLGPVRKQTQVEILASDCFKLGVKAPVRESGKLQGTPGIALVGPAGCLQLAEGVIVAQRHIHMTKEDAAKFNVTDGEIISVKFEGIRGGSLDNVLIRVTDTSKLDFHIDIDEANCLLIRDKDKVSIVK